MQYYLAVLLGCLIYLLFQLNGVFNQPDFAWKVFLKTNVISTVLNLIIGCIFVFSKAEIISFYSITFLSSVILGVAGQAIFKKIVNMFDKNEPTVFGMNNKPS
jgi:hypothetical protein